MPLPRDMTPMRLLVCEDSKASMILADAEEAVGRDGSRKLEPSQAFFSSYSRAIVMLFWTLDIDRKLAVLRRFYQSPILDGLSFSAAEPRHAWTLHTQVFSHPPHDVAEEGEVVQMEDVLLAFTWGHLHHEFINDSIYELTALRTLVQTAASEPAAFEAVKHGIFRVLLALEKSTFWRLPTSLQTKKRAFLAQELDGFEKCFFPQSSSANSARTAVPEPYVRTKVFEAYAGTWYNVTDVDKGCAPEDADVAAATAAAGVTKKPKQVAAHYGNTKRFLQRFNRPKVLIEEQRFVYEGLWHPYKAPTCSIEGASTKEDPDTKKLYTAFNVRVELGGESWTLSKRYDDFQHLQQLLEQTHVEGTPPVPTLPKNRLNFFRSQKQMLSAKFVEQQLGQLQAFLGHLLGHMACMNTLPVLRFLQRPAPAAPAAAAQLLGSDTVLFAGTLDVQHPGVLGFRATRYVVLTDEALFFYEKGEAAPAPASPAPAPSAKAGPAELPTRVHAEADLSDDIFTDIFADEEEAAPALPESSAARAAAVVEGQCRDGQRREAAALLQQALAMSEYKADDQWPSSTEELAGAKLAGSVRLEEIVRVEPRVFEGVAVGGEEAVCVQELKRRWFLFPARVPDARRDIACTWRSNLARWLAVIREACCAPAMHVRCTHA